MIHPDCIEGDFAGVQVDTERGVVSGGADPRGKLSTLLPVFAIGWEHRSVGHQLDPLLP